MDSMKDHIIYNSFIFNSSDIPEIMKQYIAMYPKTDEQKKFEHIALDFWFPGKPGYWNNDIKYHNGFY